jgi:hypothetical protein
VPIYYASEQELADFASHVHTIRLHSGEIVNREKTRSVRFDPALESQEIVHLSRIVRGKWTNEDTTIISASRLYSWTSDEDQKAYVVSVLSPTNPRP